MEQPSLFFIVGNSRSGTTLIARILKRHPLIHVLNETHFMEEFSRERQKFSLLREHDLLKLMNKMLAIQRKDYYRKAEDDEYPEDAKKIISLLRKQSKTDFAVLNRLFFEYEAERHGKVRAGDQTPCHLFYIHELLKMYPKAKFIQMIRDPRAILCSQKHKWKAGLLRGQPRFEVLRTFLNYHPITTTLIWKKTIQAGLKAQQTESTNSIKTVIFERLVERPRKEIRELCDFLQIYFYQDMINVSVEMSSNITDEGCKGISKSVSERWIDKLSETEVFITEKLAGCQMRTLGYSPTGAKPNLLKLIFYILTWPLQLATAFTLSLGRMGNPVNYISKRFFPKSKARFAKPQTFKN